LSATTSITSVSNGSCRSRQGVLSIPHISPCAVLKQRQLPLLAPPKE